MDSIFISINAVLLGLIWLSARGSLLSRPLLILITILSLYFVLLPSFNEDTFYAWRFARAPEQDLRAKYLGCSSLFLLTFWLTLVLGLRISLGKVDQGWRYLFSGFSTRGLLFSYLVFVATCFVAQVILHGSVLYMTESKSAFEVASENSSGRWSLVILGSSLIYPTVILIGHLQTTRKFKTTAFYAIILSIIYLVVCTPQTRTWAAALLLSLMFLYTEKVGLWKFLSVCLISAIIGLLLLFVLDSVRQGKSIGNDHEWSEIVTDLPKALLLLFTPYENAMLAIDHSDATSTFFWFRYLLGAATPLQLLPGALFPFRPDVDKERVMTDSIFGEIKDFDYFQDNSVFTFTVMGSGYSDGGLLGVATSGIVYAFLIVLLSKGLKFSGAARLTTYYMLLLLFAGYRLSNEVNLQGIYVIFMFILFSKILTMIRFNGRSFLGSS